MNADMTGAAVYIAGKEAMVCGRGMDEWRRSSFLDNYVSLMWVADGQTERRGVI